MTLSFSTTTKPLTLTVSMLLAACASSPDSLQTSYISDLQYKDYSCKQISGELSRISRRKNELHGTLKKKADMDTAQMAIGMVLFWPTLFLLEGGDGADAQEYSRLKGEYEALEQASLKKNCGIEFEHDAEPVAKSSSGSLNKRRR